MAEVWLRQNHFLADMNYGLKNKIFQVIGNLADEMNLETFVIGGFVRDLYLNRLSKDIDIVVIGSVIDLALKVSAHLKNKPQIHIFKNFGTAMLKYKDLEIEFVGARKESYRNDSRKPIVEDGSLEDDQNRRDFTINALAIGINKHNFGQLLDPFNGIDDLNNKIIRTPLDPDITFSDDPLRIMRAIRFSTQLRFEIHEETLASIKKNRERIKIVSGERIIEEINKIMLSDKPSFGFKLMDETGLLKIILPELLALKGVDRVNGIGHKDNFYHTLEVLDQIAPNTNDLWLRWSALLHDIAKPLTKKYIEGQGWTFHSHNFVGAKMIPELFKRLKLPLNEKMKYVQKIVQLHMRPIVLSEDVVTDSAVRRLLFEAGNDIDDLMTLCEADITSKNPEKVNRHLKNFNLVREKLKEIEEKDAIRNFEPPVKGELIMEIFGLQPCREVGIIKDAIKDAILDGIIRNDFDEAYAFMISEAEKLGLRKKN